VTETPSLSATLSVTPFISATHSPTKSPVPPFAQSLLGKCVLAPSPAVSGQLVTLYFDGVPEYSEWAIYNVAGEQVALLGFQGLGLHGWGTKGVAPGLYFVRLKVGFAGGEKREWVQKIVVVK